MRHAAPWAGGAAMGRPRQGRGALPALRGRPGAHRAGGGRRAAAAGGMAGGGGPGRGGRPLPPIWETPDELWAMIEPILAEHDPPKRGPARIDQRRALDAVIFRMRSGCQWNRLPKEYPDDSSVHRTFQRWVSLGIFDRIWGGVQEACGGAGGGAR